MKTIEKLSYIFPLFLLLSGCQAIGDIFKAGVWFGVIIVFAVLTLIGLIVKLMKG